MRRVHNAIWGRTPRRARAGFTLLELMIVVVLLGIMATMAVPGLQRWRADGRIRQGAYTVMKVARGAQYAAIRDGLAFSMVYEQLQSGGHGTIRAYRGMTNRCMRADWADATDVHGETGDMLDMVTYNPGSGVSVGDANRHVIQADVFFRGNPTAQTNVVICYEPSGIVYTSNPGNNKVGVPATGPEFPELRPQGTDIFFDVHGTFNGAEQGVVRRVIFPAGGTPRLLQGNRT